MFLMHVSDSNNFPIFNAALCYGPNLNTESATKSITNTCEGVHLQSLRKMNKLIHIYF